MLYNPLDILPKYLWKHIVSCLTYIDISKLTLLNRQFDKIIDDDNWKTLFVENRCYDIAIVKCMSSRMIGFWKHAVVNNIGCDTINKLLQFIVDDNTSDYFIYYKIFIKPGEYLFTNSDHTNYVLNKKPCSIEINGSKIARTTIKYYNCNVQVDPFSWRRIDIAISKYFSIKHIKLDDLELIFGKYDLCMNWFPSDDDFVKTYDKVELFIFDCIFNGGSSRLTINQINETNIDKCQFDNVFGIIIHTPNAYDEYNHKISEKIQKYNLEIFCKYCISNSVFTVGETCVYSEWLSGATIYFINNIINGATYVFAYITDDDTHLVVNNNFVNNVKSFLKMCSNITLDNNYFANVEKLDDDDSTDIVLNDNNIFDNCGERCMEQAAQLKIENVTS